MRTLNKYEGSLGSYCGVTVSHSRCMPAIQARLNSRSAGGRFGTPNGLRRLNISSMLFWGRIFSYKNVTRPREIQKHSTMPARSGGGGAIRNSHSPSALEKCWQWNGSAGSAVMRIWVSGVKHNVDQSRAPKQTGPGSGWILVPGPFVS